MKYCLSWPVSSNKRQKKIRKRPINNELVNGVNPWVTKVDVSKVSGEKHVHPVIQKTFGGLSKSYYFRHFTFGLIFVAIFVCISLKSTNGIRTNDAILFVVNAFLYPYSRFVYESVIGFIVGDNLFVLPAVAVLLAKLVTMIFCFMLAIFIAPIGLAYLYYYHTKQAKQD